MSWLEHVKADPRPWLLAEDTPAVRAAALQRLCDEPTDAPTVRRARSAAMVADPIRSILAAQDPTGWWVKPGPGYSPKYTGTVWQLIFLDQLGADGDHPQIASACEYVLAHTATSVGGMGCTGGKRETPPPPSTVLHCLNGNLLRALLGFGRLDDARVGAAIEWAARATTGDGVERWYPSGTSGPGFACRENEGRPCAWGGLKELSAFARIPAKRRSPLVTRAVEVGVEFLFSRDPAAADYPMGWGNTEPSRLWFAPGFPIGYSADVLQTLEVLTELGHGRDGRLAHAFEWVESRQDAQGRWPNRHAYNRKTWTDFEHQGKPSKWVTLRASAILRAVYG